MNVYYAPHCQALQDGPLLNKYYEKLFHLYHNLIFFCI